MFFLELQPRCCSVFLFDAFLVMIQSNCCDIVMQAAWKLRACLPDAAKKMVACACCFRAIPKTQDLWGPWKEVALLLPTQMMSRVFMFRESSSHKIGRTSKQSSHCTMSPCQDGNKNKISITITQETYAVQSLIREWPTAPNRPLTYVAFSSTCI